MNVALRRPSLAVVAAAVALLAPHAVHAAGGENTVVLLASDDNFNVVTGRCTVAYENADTNQATTRYVTTGEATVIPGGAVTPLTIFAQCRGFDAPAAGVQRIYADSVQHVANGAAGPVPTLPAYSSRRSSRRRWSPTSCRTGSA